MSDDTSGQTPAGWYPDGSGGRRWWDGNQWTEHTQPAEGGSSPEEGPAPTAHLPAQGGEPASYGQQGPGQQAPGQQGPGQQAPGLPSYGQGPQGQPGQWGAAPVAAGGTPPRKGKGKLIAIIAAVVAVLLVAALAVWFFAIRDSDDDNDDRSNDDTSQSDGTDDPTDDDSDDGSDDSDTPSEDPDEAALAFLEAVGAGDCDSLEGMLASDSSDTSIEELCSDPETLEQFTEGITFDFEITGVDEGDQEATVEYEVTSTYIGPDAPEELAEPGTDEGTVDLVVEDGEWKVDTFV